MPQAVAELCRQHGLWLVEDCCDALGSTLHGRPVGTFGDLATVSFYPAHQITMGEGGAVVVEDELLARIARCFRDWGRDCYCTGGENNTCGKRFSQQFGTLPFGYDHKYVYSHIGYNLKVTDIQAAIGCAQLKKLDGFVAARRRNWTVLREIFSPYGDRLLLPVAPPATRTLLFWLRDYGPRRRPVFSAAIWSATWKRQRSRPVICSAETWCGIRPTTRANIVSSGDLRNTDTIMNGTFFIGVYPGMTDAQLEYIGETFRRFMEGR